MRSVRRSLLRGHADDLALDFLVRTRTTSPRKILLNTSQAVLAETVSPTAHGVWIDPKFLGYPLSQDSCSLAWRSEGEGPLASAKRWLGLAALLP